LLPLRATQAIFEHGIRLCAQVSLAPYVYGRDRQFVGLTPTERLNEIPVDGYALTPLSRRAVCDDARMLA